MVDFLFSVENHVSMENNPLRQELYDLVETHVYRYSPEAFELASGKKSHHYFNCKEIMMYPRRMDVCIRYIFSFHIPKYIVSLPDALGGLTLGADPLAYGVAQEFFRNSLQIYPLVVRKETKGHGTRKRIEGAVEKVSSCLVIDDVITTGASTLKAVEALREAGKTVETGICLIDREEGGLENLEKEGVTIFPLFRKSEFVKDGYEKE